MDDHSFEPMSGDVPVARLGRLYAELGSGTISPTTREYLVSAIEAAVRRDEPLHVALGMSRSGRYGSVRSRLLFEKRNDCLMEAFHLVSLDEGAVDYTRCKRLSAQIRPFILREWPQARRRLDPDPEWPAWKCAVFRAAQTGLPVALSPNALHNIVQSRALFSMNREWMRMLSNLL